MHNATIDLYLTRHEATLYEVIQSASIPASCIKDAMLYSLFPGGKRLRPLLVYLCGHLIGANVESIDIIAASIELIHCYSLIHDDLPAMDNDDFRRGKPSCHRAFDEATAILVGDGMQALAIEILLTHLPKSLPLEQVVAISLELTRACGVSGMVSGQSLDLSELAKPDIDEHQLSNIHTLKTSQLMMACINMIVLSTNHPAPSFVTALQQFSKHLGIAFQMQDDYLDRYDTNDTLGKKRASDISNQKITFATLYERDVLLTKINHLFQLAFDALAPFKDHANDLKAFVRNLQHRILFKPC